jgi:uncharacterized protein involved in exopolysaccharide biosynthesis/Mrp family chromosome partitioning ATPase
MSLIQVPDKPPTIDSSIRFRSGIETTHWFAPNPEDELHVKDLWKIVRRRIRMVGLLALAGASLSGAYVVLAHKKFTAVATVEVAGQSSPEISLQDLAQSSGSDATTPELLTTEINTQVAQLGSEATLTAVMDQLGLEKVEPFAVPGDTPTESPLYAERALPISKTVHERSRALRIMNGHLKVSVLKGTRMLAVAYTDRNPELASQIANAIVDVHILQSFRDRVNAYDQISSWMSRQLASLKQDVEINQQKAEQFQNNNRLVGTFPPVHINSKTGGSDELSTGQGIPVNRLLDLNQQLTNAQIARISKEAIYRLTSTGDPQAVLAISGSALANDIHGSVFAPGGSGLMLLQSLREQQAQNQVQLSYAATKYGPKSQTLIDLQARQASVAAQIQSEMGHINVQASGELQLARQTESALRDEITEQETKVAQWSSKQDQWQVLVGEATASRDLYEDMQAKFHEAKFASGMRSPRLAVVDSAKMPSEASAPNVVSAIVLGPFLGAVIGLVLVFVLDYFDDTLYSANQVRKNTRRNILGRVLPTSRAGRSYRQTLRRLMASGSIVDIKPVVSDDVDSSMTHAFRSVRTALMRGLPALNGQVVTLVSCTDREKLLKTGVDLGATFALLGRDVLVVDTNLHRGSGIGRGLLNCLQDNLPLSHAVVPADGVDHLYLLGSGGTTAHGSELLQSGAFVSLLKEARSRYDLVLLLASSALKYTDAAVVADRSDWQVAVVDLGITREHELQETLSTISSGSASLLGCVLNG